MKAFMDFKKYFNCKNYRDMLALMFAQTDKEGNLDLPLLKENSVWHEGDPDDVKGILHARMLWGRSDLEDAIQETSTLIENLRLLAAMKDILKETEDANAAILSAPLLKVWKTYVRKVWTPRQLVPAGIAEKLDAGEELEEEESRIYHSINEAVEQMLAEERIGGLQAYELLMHGSRLYQWFLISAPSIILANEEIDLAQQAALHAYAKHIDCEYFETERKEE
jgi:hypothetical protein